jgi:hypothetical protein
MGSRPCSNKSALKSTSLQIEFRKKDVLHPKEGFEVVAFAGMDFYLCSQGRLLGCKTHPATTLKEGFLAKLPASRQLRHQKKISALADRRFVH